MKKLSDYEEFKQLWRTRIETTGRTPRRYDCYLLGKQKGEEWKQFDVKDVYAAKRIIQIKSDIIHYLNKAKFLFDSDLDKMKVNQIMSELSEVNFEKR